MKRTLALVVVLVLTMWGVCGCGTLLESDPDNATDEQPWNRPADWEGQILGVPY